MSEGFAKDYFELNVYQAALRVQRDVFECSRQFPKEEVYSLTDQIRRSSRSMGANIAEAWAKRRYPAHFCSKLSDAEGEANETRHWIQTAFDSGYIKEDIKEQYVQDLQSIAAMLGAMMAKSQSFKPKTDKTDYS